jgi:hypothetical protein
MLLTDEERKKFAAYLRQDAMSNRLLAKQLATMPSPTMKRLHDQKIAEATAEEMVAHILESTSSATISST